MKRNMKDCFCVGLIALLVSIFVFLLFNSGILIINTISFAVIISLIFIAIFVLIALLRMQGNEFMNYIKESYCCCGNLIAIGAAGTFVLSILFLFVNEEIEILLIIVLAILFFFLVLMAGGIVCLLYAINECHSCNTSPCDDHPHDKEDCRKNEYYRHEYNERRR